MHSLTSVKPSTDSRAMPPVTSAPSVKTGHLFLPHLLTNCQPRRELSSYVRAVSFCSAPLMSSSQKTFWNSSILHQLDHTYSQPHQCHQRTLPGLWCCSDSFPDIPNLFMNPSVFFFTIFTSKLADTNASCTCPVLSHMLSGNLWNPQLHYHSSTVLSNTTITSSAILYWEFF